MAADSRFWLIAADNRFWLIAADQILSAVATFNAHIIIS